MFSWLWRWFGGGGGEPALQVIDARGSVAAVLARGSAALPEHADIEFYRGEDVAVQVTVPGVDLTADALLCAIRLTPSLNPAGDGAGALVSKSTGAGIVTTYNPATAQSVATVAVLEADTTSLAAGTYYWSLARVASGKHAVLSEGRATVLASAALP